MQKKYGVNELRKMFLDFFESKGHLCKSSYSLVPHNDNSVLLIPAGMAPLKPYFTGRGDSTPQHAVATCQKCIRTGDIENVGKTARHGTFFEMLGNFSFGDYFKKEAIALVLGIPHRGGWPGSQDRLYPSIYEDDDEAFEIWNKAVRASRRSVSSASARRTTSGSTAQAPAVPVPRSTMTAARSMAAASPAVP